MSDPSQAILDERPGPSLCGRPASRLARPALAGPTIEIAIHDDLEVVEKEWRRFEARCGLHGVPVFRLACHLAPAHRPPQAGDAGDRGRPARRWRCAVHSAARGGPWSRAPLDLVGQRPLRLQLSAAGAAISPNGRRRPSSVELWSEICRAAAAATATSSRSSRAEEDAGDRGRTAQSICATRCTDRIRAARISCNCKVLGTRSTMPSARRRHGGAIEPSANGSASSEKFASSRRRNRTRSPARWKRWSSRKANRLRGWA